MWIPLWGDAAPDATALHTDGIQAGLYTSSVMCLFRRIRHATDAINGNEASGP
jgi:hypothetical protein